MQVVIVLIIISAVLLSQVLAKAWDSKRFENIKNWALGKGIEAYYSLPSVDAEKLFSFDVAKKGASSTTRFVVVAETETTRICVFEQRFTNQSGKNSSTKSAVMTMVQDRRLSAPAVSIVPRRFLSSLSKLIGVTYIEFPDAPEFSQKFMVRGKSEEAIRAFLTSTLLSKLASIPPMEIGFHDDTLLLVNWENKLQPAEIESYMRKGLEVLSMCHKA
jgi:hypothetical protein